MNDLLKEIRLGIPTVLALLAMAACGGSNDGQQPTSSDGPTPSVVTATPASWGELTADPIPNDLIGSIAALSPEVAFGGYARFLDSGGPLTAERWAQDSCVKTNASYYTDLGWLNGHKRVYQGRKNVALPLGVGMTVELYGDAAGAHRAFVDHTHSMTFEALAGCGATLSSEFSGPAVGDESWAATYDPHSKVLPSDSSANVTFRIGRIVATLFVFGHTADEARMQLAAQADPTIQTIKYILTRHDYPTAPPTPSRSPNPSQARVLPLNH